MACIVTISCFNINLNGRKFWMPGKNGIAKDGESKQQKKNRQKEKTTGFRVQENAFFSRLILLCVIFAGILLELFPFLFTKRFSIFFFPEYPNPKLHFTTKIAFYCPTRGFGYTPDSKYKQKNLPNGTYSISFILASKKIQLHGKIRKMAKSGFCRKFCFELQQFALITADKTKITHSKILFKICLSNSNLQFEIFADYVLACVIFFVFYINVLFILCFVQDWPHENFVIFFTLMEIGCFENQNATFQVIYIRFN